MSPHTRPVALVTGAGSGIGAATARELAASGWDVGLVGRRREPLSLVAADVEAAGGHGYVLVADQAEATAPATAVAALTDATGRLDGIVANAATVRHRPIDEWDTAEFDDHLAVSVRGPYFLVQAALPWLRRSGQPAVVFVSSSSGTLTIPTQSVYGMTKAALDYLTRSLAGELASERIRVNCVAPGPVDTPIHRTWADDLQAAYAWLSDQVPLGRIAAADELALWIRRLLEPSASFVTGVVLPIDGGQILNRGAS